VITWIKVYFDDITDVALVVLLLVGIATDAERKPRHVVLVALTIALFVIAGVLRWRRRRAARKGSAR
jgi:hypothetical protein